MMSHSFRERLFFLGGILVVTRCESSNFLSYLGAVFLVEFIAESVTILWTAADGEKSRKG